MFTGFTQQTVDFLWQLRLNNNKEWFTAHKTEYEQLYLTPFRTLGNELLAAVQEEFPDRCWQLHVSRIYRDARRLHGQAPLNDHLWFTLFADAPHDLDRPGFYFAFTPEVCQYGLGCWMRNTEMMQRFREQVADNPAPAERLAAQLAGHSELVAFGERYKKTRAPQNPVLQGWIDRKNLGFGTEFPHDARSLSPALPERLLQAYRFLMPLHEYFTALVDRA